MTLKLCNALAAVLLATTAQAQSVKTGTTSATKMTFADNPVDVAQMMKKAGNRAILGKTTDADVEWDIDSPTIESALGQSRYDLYFYDCSAPNQCDNVQFRAYYDGRLPTEKTASMKAAHPGIDMTSDRQNVWLLSMDVDLRFRTADDFKPEWNKWVAAMGEF